MSKARFQLYYWPVPFRACFVSYLFACRGVPFLEETRLEENKRLMDLNPDEQGVPYMGPPVLYDRETGRTLSQMPAIVLYLSPGLDLAPDDPFELAMCMKVLMDCNDVLMEVCRYNGSSMWDYEAWSEFRTRRLSRWMRIFEEGLARGFVGTDRLSFADIGVFALFGNMTRCLPELEADLLRHAPGIHALCRRVGAVPSLALYVADQEKAYGRLYCGGQIEQSIRKMLAQDEANGPR